MRPDARNHGSSKARFLTTRWSLVARASDRDDPASEQALEELCQAYWWPMYAYVRRLRTQSAEAADIVQGLLFDIIEKHRLESADAGRGRFRDWLRTALEFHIGHLRERQSAKKRGGDLRAVSFDVVEAEERWGRVPNRELDPATLFDRAWALEVLARAIASVERDYARRGRRPLFEALKHTLAPGAEGSSYAALASRLGTTEGAVKIAAHRLRASYRKALRDELRSTVEDPTDADAEFAALMDALGAS